MNLENNIKMVSEVDLPQIPNELIQKILEWHDSAKKVLENPGAVSLDTPWLATTIRDYDTNIKMMRQVPCNVENEIPGLPWNKDFVDRFPEFVDILNSLPLEKVTRVYLLETRKACTSHVDSSKNLYTDLSMEPCNFRVNFRNTSNSKGFFVQPKPRKEWGNERAIVSGDIEYKVKKYIPPIYWQPPVGVWWVLNNYCCQHGSEWRQGDNKVILSVQGTPDKEKHLMLLDRSKELNFVCHPYVKHLTSFYNQL